jgi:hypothetical protein
VIDEVECVGILLLASFAITWTIAYVAILLPTTGERPSRLQRQAVREGRRAERWGRIAAEIELDEADHEVRIQEAEENSP